LGWKLAVLLHRLWIGGEPFRRRPEHNKEQNM
jgi:hypothetical protein